jgi:asparagine synthase (glutamine-hydrolysing)
VYSPETGLKRYFRLKTSQQELYDAEEIVTALRLKVEQAIETRMHADVPVGAFLSGGLDSSIVAAVARKHTERLHTFSVGMEGAEDIEAAREAAGFFGTEHQERVFSLQEVALSLPEVIRHLESYDVALVRSAIANHFLAESARQHVKVALSGEGADELFAGYASLRSMAAWELKRELRRATLALHNTNLQRCDRISMAHGLEVRVPFVDDLSVIEFAFRIPIQFKMLPGRGIEKWVLRRAFEGTLPDTILNRKKKKFAEGAGLGQRLSEHVERLISDEEFERVCSQNGAGVRSKEELYYDCIFRDFYPGVELQTLIGRSASV